ncbi:hypothetical protein PT974_01764 [Cladobotryum mycophilum]|uniref:Uncharacterized protein n=1 Tax=Cladobotryum mycophilum TaxID=491253 RepID=A0ABR0SW66_9HYPO
MPAAQIFRSGADHMGAEDQVRSPVFPCIIATLAGPSCRCKCETVLQEESHGACFDSSVGVAADFVNRSRG